MDPFPTLAQISKPQATLEILDKEETWSSFYPLGDWVKKIPDRLRILWTSNDEEELLATRRALTTDFFTATQIAGNEEVQEHQAHELARLLVEVLIGLAHELELPDASPWSGLPSPITAISEGSEYMDGLLASANGDVLLLQSCAFVAVREGCVSSTDSALLDKLVQVFESVTDDPTRACYVNTISNLLKNSFFIEDTRKQAVHAQLDKILTEPGMCLSKLMAAIACSRRMTVQTPPEVLFIMADYILHQKVYEEAMSNALLRVIIDLYVYIPNSVTALPPVADLFLDRVLTNLATINRESATTPSEFLVCALLVLQCAVKEPIVPGMKVVDLSAQAAKALARLAELDKVWSNEQLVRLLARRGVPSTKDELVAFLSDTADDGTKRYPKFEGLDQVPWHELTHAYGEAVDVPGLLKMLASSDANKCKQALSTLYSNILHQGTTYPATPYAVPYLIELLECTMVHSKRALLTYLANLLCSFYQDYFFTKDGFDVDVEYADLTDEYCVVKHDIEKKIMSGLPVIFDLLAGTESTVRAGAAFLLSFLPKAASQSVPKIKEQISRETDLTAKADMLLALSFLYPRACGRDASLQYYNDQWLQYKDTQEHSIKFCIAACVARLCIDVEKPPKYAAEELRRPVGHPEIEGQIQHNSFGSASSLAVGLMNALKSDDDLPAVVQQFKGLRKMSGTMSVLSAMLSIAFRFERENQKPILAASLKPEQLEVLQAICDQSEAVIWNFGNATMLLRDYGLPSEKDELLELIEKAKASKDMLCD